MFRVCSDFLGCQLTGGEGIIGRVSDLYFSDLTWKIAFLVVTIGRARSARRILLPAASIASADFEARKVHSSWTPHDVENATSANSLLPVSKQCEILRPGMIQAHQLQVNPHLRSFLAVQGYNVFLARESRGQLAELVLGDDWTVRFLQLQFQIGKKSVTFHLGTSSVERFSSLSRKVSLKSFDPVRMDQLDLVEFPAERVSEVSIA